MFAVVSKGLTKKQLSCSRVTTHLTTKRILFTSQSQETGEAHSTVRSGKKLHCKLLSKHVYYSIDDVRLITYETISDLIFNHTSMNAG